MPEKKKTKNLKNKKSLEARKQSSRKKKAPLSKAAAQKKKAKAAGSSSKETAKGHVLPVFDMSGKERETLELDPLFHASPVNKNLVYQSILKYQAGQRLGTASTLDRGHVRGGGKKPWKQKGTGQARHGSRRSPLWRHGGVTFGPMPRDYSYSLPTQMKRGAVVEGVKDKVAGGKLIFLQDLRLEAPRTKLVVNLMKTFKLERPLLLVEEKLPNLLLASRNIRSVSVKTSGEINALDVLSHRECVMTKAAYQGLVKRLKS